MGEWLNEPGVVRSGRGIAVTLVALATSHVWCPAPATPDPAVVQMLRTETDYLFGEWNTGEIAIAPLVPLIFGGVATALWRRSADLPGPTVVDAVLVGAAVRLRRRAAHAPGTGTESVEVR